MVSTNSIFVDKEGWPHYKVKEELPPLKAGEQSVLMKEAIVNYFRRKRSDSIVLKVMRFSKADYILM